jgi:hypothetical protein
MKTRRFTVSSIFREENQVPAIRLSGNWLSCNGFQIGVKYLVYEKPGTLIISLIEDKKRVFEPPMNANKREYQIKQVSIMIRDETFGNKLARDGFHLVAGPFTTRSAKISHHQSPEFKFPHGEMNARIERRPGHEYPGYKMEGPPALFLK